MEILFKDIRYAIRGLLKQPAFTAVVVCTLALGVGANTAMFSVVNGVLLRPLPYTDPDHLAMLWTEDAKHGLHEEGTGYLTFEDWKKQTHVFADIAVSTTDKSVALTGVDEPERIGTEAVSANLFSVLGTQPILGRTFSREDEDRRERVAVLSHKLWQRRFGGARDVVGKTIEINGQGTQVIGVMPPDFFYPTKETLLWEPVTSFPFWDREKTRRFTDWWRVVGRLKPGTTFPQAQTEMNAIRQRLEQAYPVAADSDFAGFGVNVVPIFNQVTSADLRLALWSLLGAIFFVLLIACTNIANLMLARGAARQRDFAIRGALGASRTRLMRQSLTESAAIAVAAGLLGLLVAAVGIRILVAFGPQDVPRLEEIGIDTRVLGFTFGLALLASLLSGSLPALRLSGTDPNDSLKEGARGSSGGPGGQRMRRLLVTLEIALSVVLLVGAGLLIRSFLKVQAVDPGFLPDRLLSMKVTLPDKTPKAEVRAFYQQALERLASLPGVASVGATRHVFLETHPDVPIFLEGHSQALSGKSQEQLTYDEVSAGYFTTLGLPLLKGRFFSEQDGPEAPLVAIINQTMARRFFDGEDPVGKRFKENSNPNAPFTTIVGVVGDMRRQGLEKQPISQYFIPLSQNPASNMIIVVRTSGDPLPLAAAVSREVRGVNKQAILSATATVEQQLEGFNSQRRFQTWLLGLFALFALVLTALGIFGVVNYSVTERTHELGIRLALGAQVGDVMKMILGQGMKLIAGGIVIGLLASFALTRLLKSLLFGVSDTDPLTFVAITLVLMFVALLACYIPARRATKVDPLVALRYE